MTTTRDVAKLAGVSAMTVSNVLNSRPGCCSEATRKRVLQAVAELGYAAHPLPNSERAGELALVLGTASSDAWIPPALIPAVQAAVEASGRHLLLLRFGAHDAPGGDHLLRLVRERRIDGVLINGHDDTEADAIAKALRKTPCVFLNQRRSHDAVHPDDRGAGAAAYCWLRERGARRVALLAKWGHGHCSMDDRRAGFLEAARQAGDDDASVLAPAAGSPDLASLVERALDLGIDGACCYSEREAAVLCHCALGRGMTPGSLQAATFSTAPYAFGDWQLATWILPFAEVGRRGVSMLLNRLARDTPQPVESIPIPHRDPPWALQ